ncbi:MAG: hypothetical protein Q8M09_12275 [Pseudomonadota bacterium]|nr:hypothetical protein [Pseudomonadota bacterium]
MGELRKAYYTLLFNALRYLWRANLRIQGNGFRGAKQRGTIQQGMSAGIAMIDAEQQNSTTTQERKPGERKEEKRAKQRKGATQFVMASALVLTKNIGR